LENCHCCQIYESRKNAKDKTGQSLCPKMSPAKMQYYFLSRSNMKGVTEMKTLDKKKIQDAALEYHRNLQSERENTQNSPDNLKSRISRMRKFTSDIFSAEDDFYVNNTLDITEAFCIAFAEPSELKDIEDLLIDFAFLCEALVSTSNFTHYRLTVSENSISFAPK
jgi:hypothetical protein